MGREEGSPNLGLLRQTQVLWKACEQGYQLVPSLKGARRGDHTPGACQNSTHFGLQIAPSVNFSSKASLLEVAHIFIS